ncbi:MAG: hypothetical protein A2Y36_01900 [Treponema sp. GWA1_62_8]|nr:MAG: hypothetical protein A2Y36_01900 [Treponema sp. GWA1_62_8]
MGEIAKLPPLKKVRREVQRPAPEGNASLREERKAETSSASLLPPSASTRRIAATASAVPKGRVAPSR